MIKQVISHLLTTDLPPFDSSACFPFRKYALGQIHKERAWFWKDPLKTFAELNSKLRCKLTQSSDDYTFAYICLASIREKTEEAWKVVLRTCGNKRTKNISGTAALLSTKFRCGHEQFPFTFLTFKNVFILHRIGTHRLKCYTVFVQWIKAMPCHHGQTCQGHLVIGHQARKRRQH